MSRISRQRLLLASWVEVCHFVSIRPAPAGSFENPLRIDQPQSNHDGFLYISLGEGGAADDQGDGHVDGGNTQYLESIYGKLIRIDVNARTSANGQYGIPANNPFASGAGIDEIYAFVIPKPTAIPLTASRSGAAERPIPVTTPGTGFGSFRLEATTCSLNGFTPILPPRRSMGRPARPAGVLIDPGAICGRIIRNARGAGRSSSAARLT